MRPYHESERRVRRAGAMAVFVTALLLWTDGDASACQMTTCSESDATGCERDPLSLCWTTGLPVSWAQACTSYSLLGKGIPTLGLDFAATESLVTAAFQRWLSVSCGNAAPSLGIAPIGPILCDDIEYNPRGPNANSVLFHETDWAHDPSALGLTTVTFESSTGRILDADMEINLARPEISIDTLPYIVTHEAGHFLGLDHSAEPAALMYAQYTPSDRVTPDPALDDTNTICAAYPARTLGECNFSPELGFDALCGGDLRGGCSFRPGPVSKQAGFVSVLGAFALVGWRRRRRTTDTR